MTIGRKRQRKKTQTQSKEVRQAVDPIGIWLTGQEAKDLLLPSGYKPITKNEEVRKCTHKIADLVSSMTIMLMENGDKGDRRLKNELSKKIDVYPNKNMVRKNFVYKIVTDMIETGNSVVYPKMKEGLLDNLVIWNPGKLSFKGDEEEYQILKSNVAFDPDELLHFVLVPDDEMPYRGQGYTSAIKDTITNLVQANATKTGFLQSKWKPSLIIKVESDAEGMQIKEERDKILHSYVGDTEAGEPWIVPASEIDVKEVRPLTLQDLAIQDSITLDKRAVASAFGVPPFMIGVGEFKKDEYNNFISSVIMPIAKIIEQELTRKLIYSPTWYFKFNPKSLMQYDLGELTTHAKEMVAIGMMNRNEGRNLFDYSPAEGLDEYAVLENHIPVEDIGNQKKLDKGGEE
ncbi:phage portal protein [Sutcliffiella cohnii]|uniref:phage portal protein n=1 Tax=Sutcliffiella cohnii TaxID=33932 RepID=UPI002E22D925|nr:phage portal protein [Sutcliffiella cohnii]MED4016991.1 phage portal protein [Sutcliffiella cohnii]